MNKDLSDITIVLDSSSSMSCVQGVTESSLREFIHDQQHGPGKALLTLIEFSNVPTIMYNALPIDDLPEYEYCPSGMTALFDAIAVGIVRTGERLKAMDEADRPGVVIFVIITDGEENCSRTYSNYKEIHDMIVHQTDKYNWKFMFLGANQDAIASGARLGISANNAITFGTNIHGVSSVARGTSCNVMAYRTGQDHVEYSQEIRASAMGCADSSNDADK